MVYSYKKYNTDSVDFMVIIRLKTEKFSQRKVPILFYAIFFFSGESNESRQVAKPACSETYICEGEVRFTKEA